MICLLASDPLAARLRSGGIFHSNCQAAAYQTKPFPLWYRDEQTLPPDEGRVVEMAKATNGDELQTAIVERQPPLDAKVEWTLALGPIILGLIFAGSLLVLSRAAKE